MGRKTLGLRFGVLFKVRDRGRGRDRVKVRVKCFVATLGLGLELRLRLGLGLGLAPGYRVLGTHSSGGSSAVNSLIWH